MRVKVIALLLGASLAVTACGQNASLPPDTGYGKNPTLPKPQPELFPTYNVPSNKGWHGETPTAAPGLAVEAFAKDLKHPRWLYVLPNGDVLVAESSRGT